MIKVRLVPEFFFAEGGFNNYVYEKRDVKNAFYIECELPCVPEKGSAIGIADFKEEIFSQYSRFLMKINNNIHEAIGIIRSHIDDEDYTEYKNLRKEYPNLANAGNIDILRAVINQTRGYNVYNGAGFVRVASVLYFPNDEYVYIDVNWEI